MNLGAWHGFQEVIYKEPLNPEEIETDFLLTDNSYFYLIFNKDKDNFSAIRISVNKAFKSAFVTANTNGKFTKKTELPINNLKKNHWNHLKIIFNNNSVTFFINKQLIGNFSKTLLLKQHFGFRGSFNPVYIDNVIVKQKGSGVKRTFKDKILI